MEEQCTADINAKSWVKQTTNTHKMCRRIISNVIFIFRIVFGLFFVMNLVLWHKGSSGAVPFSTLVALLALWFCVSVPLTFIGAYFGFRKRVSGHRLNY